MIAFRPESPELKEQTAARCEITRQDVMRFLADIVRMDLNEPLKPSDQLRAAEIMIKMCGWMRQRSSRLDRPMS